MTDAPWPIGHGASAFCGEILDSELSAAPFWSHPNQYTYRN